MTFERRSHLLGMFGELKEFGALVCSHLHTFHRLFEFNRLLFLPIIKTYRKGLCWILLSVDLSSSVTQDDQHVSGGLKPWWRTDSLVPGTRRLSRRLKPRLRLCVRAEKN